MVLLTDALATFLLISIRIIMEVLPRNLDASFTATQYVCKSLFKKANEKQVIEYNKGFDCKIESLA